MIGISYMTLIFLITFVIYILVKFAIERPSKNQSKFFHTKKEQKVPKNIDLDQLIWASVGKLPNFLLKEENEIKTKDSICNMY